MTTQDKTKTPDNAASCCCGPPVALQPKSDETRSDEQVRQTVRDAYGSVAENASSSCCGPSPCCPGEPTQYAEQIGYSSSDLADVPEGANLGLGCGNPTALAALKPGEVVLDLGAGAGFDAFIAAKQVGSEGRVIGVDMTPEMLARARENAVKAGVASHVEFREGTIEQLPVVANSVDVIISNCVINLSPDKAQVFREAFRVLKPGGRLAVSDIVLSEPLPEDIARIAAVYVGCIGGALVEKEYLGAIEAAGFVAVDYTRSSAAVLLEAMTADPMAQTVIEQLGQDRVAAIAKTIYSYKIEARKP